MRRCNNIATDECVPCARSSFLVRTIQILCFIHWLPTEQRQETNLLRPLCAVRIEQRSFAFCFPGCLVLIFDENRIALYAFAFLSFLFLFGGAVCFRLFCCWHSFHLCLPISLIFIQRALCLGLNVCVCVGSVFYIFIFHPRCRYPAARKWNKNTALRGGWETRSHQVSVFKSWPRI